MAALQEILAGFETEFAGSAPNIAGSSSVNQ